MDSLKETLLVNLLPRVSLDLHRGLLLETVHRLLHEHLIPLTEIVCTEKDNLYLNLIAHANIYIVKRDILATSKGYHE